MTGQMGAPAAYDEISDWYHSYIGGPAAAFTARAGEALRMVLGVGGGVCWDLACGTGVYTDLVRELGWTPLGSDISRGQLRYARQVAPVVQADAARLPLADGSVTAVAAVLCHTDVPDYAALCREAARVLAPGGRFAHVGVHPCFVGAFVDRTDPDRLVTTSGYRQPDPPGFAPSGGVRVRVGATHLPLADLLTAISGAGLVVDSVTEAGSPTPDVLAIGAQSRAPS